MATIVDVAALAGVSTATVSRVLNGKPVREDLAAAVHQAADELGYSPNRTARSLRRQSSEVIALIVADIENPFFTSLARGVEDVAQEAGFCVVLCNSDDDPSKEERYLGLVDSENMAGVILASATSSPKLARLIEHDRAVVVIDRPVDDEVDQVTFDNVEIARTATLALVRRGFSRIACVTGPQTTSTANERAEGWRQGLQEAGLSASDELLFRANFRVDGGRKAARSILAMDSRPDAVIAMNNLVGVGILQVLAEREGLEHELGVGVIGDLPIVTPFFRNLTLVPLRPREMGVTAAKVLISRIRGDVRPARRLVQPVHNVVGEMPDLPE